MSLQGFLNVAKKKGITSARAVSTVKRLLGASKAGHTGTLDPLATGVLVVTLGKATSLTRFVHEFEKNYRASFEFGYITDTLDVTGTVVERSTASPPSRSALEEILRTFLGGYEQVPPAFSACRFRGMRHYELARAGLNVERNARRVSISRLELVRYDESRGVGEVLVTCGSGTYIRSLIHDIAAKLGRLATMTALERTAVGFFKLEEAISLDFSNLEKEAVRASLLRRVISMEEFLVRASLPTVTLNEREAKIIAHGGSILRPHSAPEQAFLLTPLKKLLAFAVSSPDSKGVYRPVRVFSEASDT